MNCHTVTLKMGDLPENSEPINPVSLQHYTTIMGWKEISQTKSIDCPKQDGNIVIQEDVWDGIIYFFLAPFLISESIEISCSEVK